MDRIDWVILDCLADDFESIQQIYPMIKKENISIEEAINRLISLYQNGYVCLNENDTLNIEALSQDIEKCDFPRFQFGLTNEGEKYREDNALKFSGSEIDWKNAWVASLDYKSGTGFVCGKTKKICELFLKDHLKKEKEIILDELSLDIQRLKNFKLNTIKSLMVELN